MERMTLIAALGAMLVAAPANAQTDYRIRVGLGAQVQPEYPGADSNEVLPFPKFSIAKRNEPFGFGAPDDSLAIGLISSGGFSAGPAFALGPSRDDSDVGAPVGDVKRAIEVGGFVQQYLGDNFRLRAELRQGIGGHKGLTGLAGADYVARDADRYTFSIGPRVRYGGSNYMDSFFGVDPQVALATGLPVHDADGGIRAIGAITGFTYSLGGPIDLFGYGRYDRLVGDAKDSPIVQQFGSRDQWSGGLGLAYRFNINL